MGAVAAHSVAAVAAATVIAGTSVSAAVQASQKSSPSAFVHTRLHQPKFIVRASGNATGIDVRVLSAGRIEEIAALEFSEAESAWESANLVGAIHLFLKSAQKGHEVGEYCFRWGLYHELPPSDVVQARRWYGRGARLFHKGCTTMLGKLHMAKGEAAKATEFLLKTGSPQRFGGASGDSLAQWFLAEMNFQSGELRKAVRWWKRSAENGDIDAMYRLAEVFTDGAMGIPQDVHRGLHWLSAAAAHGHQMALSRVSLSNETSDRPKVERQWLERMEALGWV